MRMVTECQKNQSACNLPHEETGQKCFQINPGMKSKDQRQPLKKSNEEESKSFELLQRALPGLDWPMLAHTHVHTGVEPMAKKKPSVGLCPT